MTSVSVHFVAPVLFVAILQICNKVCCNGRSTLSQIALQQSVPQSPHSLVYTLSQWVVVMRKKKYGKKGKNAIIILTLTYEEYM
jgi:hypothetical protein